MLYWIPAHGKIADIPILFMTACDDIASKQRGFRIGADDYMVKPIDLNELILRIGALLRRARIASERRLEIDTDLEENIIVRADEELLSLVWNNLFSNAFKFTGAGGRVSVSMSADDGYAQVRVSDTGCGMSEEVGRHIFEKFYQGDTSHASQGNGLGLALVKQVVDILKGEISVESTVGEGTAITVKIRRL